MGSSILDSADRRAICAAYRDAESKKGQVLLLAQRYSVKPSEIVAVLEKKGFAVNGALTGFAPEPDVGRRRFAAAVKQKAVQAVVEGANFAQAAAEIGTSKQNVVNWVRLAAERDGMGRDEWLAGKSEARPKARGIKANADFEDAVREMEAGAGLPAAGPAREEAVAPSPQFDIQGAEAVVASFEQAWDSLWRLVPLSKNQQEVVEDILLFGKGFAAALRCVRGEPPQN